MQIKMEQNSRSRGFSRRQILGGGGALAAASVLGARTAAQREFGPGSGGTGAPVFVQLFLRGGIDGLSAVVPHGDDDLYAARPTLAVPKPGQPGGAIDLDGFFGLNPFAAPLLTPYGNGHLSLVHAAGSTDPTRSHFDAFEKMEFGEPGLPQGTGVGGWLSRYLQGTASGATGVLRGVALSDILPKTLGGAPASLPIPNPGAFTFPGNPNTALQRVDLLTRMYTPQPPPVGSAALSTFASIDLMGTVDFAGAVPANGAVYPGSELGGNLRDAATLIKAGVGVEAITIDYGSWDHHANQGPLTGTFASQMSNLSAALEAFYLDLLGNLGDYVLVVISEFGRRVAENGSAGTDHGHGNTLWVMGGGIAGGQVLSSWPGLAPAQLDNGDLAITTDYRDVLGEVLAQRFGATRGELLSVFPQHAFQPVGITSL